MDLKHRAESAARSPWMDRVEAFGFVAKGAVYAIIGVLALQVAFGDGGAFLDSNQAADQVKVQPFGQVLLALLGTGLGCYALWHFAQAALDPGGHDHGVKRIAKRIGWAGTGVLHTFLAVSAFQTLAGVRGNDRKSSWLAMLLDKPGGSWAMIAIGVAIIAAGAYQFVRAYKASFEKKLETHRMSATERLWTRRVGRFGLIARGMVFPIIGWFFIQAGRHANAKEAEGTGAALREIATNRWGEILLPIVAAGLCAYAIFMLVSAKYRKSYA
jgi:hypothetical protein